MKIADNKLLQSGFLRELCNYFMEFLQSNFKRQKFPKRHIKFKNEKGFKVGLDASKYEKFNILIKKLIAKSFVNADGKLKIKKSVYTKKPDKKTADLINKSIASINKKQITLLRNNIEKILKTNSKKFKNDSKLAHDIVSKEIRAKFKEIIIDPIKNICEPLILSQSVYDIDSLYTLEIGLEDTLTNTFDENIYEMMNDFLLKQTKEINKKINNFINEEEIKKRLISFFEGLNINDLYFEIQELYNSKFNLDKQDFYLYFCELELQNKRFPIFYMPIDIIENKGENSFSISFDKEIFINKKAIHFAIQEFNRDNKSLGKINSISDRIIYLDEEGKLIDRLNLIIKDICDYFRIEKSPDLNLTTQQISKSISCIVSNNCSICVFDKSDESLINDYEEILTLLENEDSEASKMFKDIINDFLLNEPEGFIENIESDWDNSSTDDRLNYTSPIPLNYEQQKILSALNKDKCKYVVVEGPPGTGKSHTISAIAFNYILEGKSTLILSDTKYALDVVEDKINQTLNKVRHTEDFQNPILRLGKMGNTYSKILSNASMGKIRDYHRSTKTHYSKLQNEIKEIDDHIEEKISKDLSSYKKMDNKRMKSYLQLHLKYAGENSLFDFSEIDNNSSIHNIDILELIEIVKKDNAKDLFFILNDLYKKPSEKNYQNFFEILKFISKINQFDINLLKNFKNIKSGYVEKINNFKSQYRDMKGLLGYLLKGPEITALSDKIKRQLTLKKEFNIKLDEDFLNKIKDNLLILENYFEDNKKNIPSNFNLNKLYELLYKFPEFLDLCKNEKNINDIENLYNYLNSIPKNCNNLSINLTKPETIFRNKLTTLSNAEEKEIFNYLEARSYISESMGQINNFDYSTAIQKKQNLYTSEMTHQLDDKIVGFFDKYRTTAKTLSKIIRSKSKFPTTEFKKLKQAFPCIISSVRDFAEYINLKKDLFDLIIIDEASQVSIAQAIPALIRAKKVLVLGDNKQFSNVKSIQAKNVENTFYLDKIKNSFKKLSKDRQILERLKLFNVKSSVLDFFSNIANYETRLKKHFRGYKEHISYSSKYFYDNQIQAIRLRPPGKTLQDIIKFKIIDKPNKDPFGNENKNEADFIINELEVLKRNNYTGTVGIITPFTDQQKLLRVLISRHSDRDFFFEKFKLKIMTFDTCQGEERQTVYYSMVADKINDKLWTVFPKSLEGVDLDEQSNHRAQRLNVGLSRVQECMFYVLSKNPKEINGEVGNALRHYYKLFETTENLPKESDLDPKSPMEKKVLGWIKNTEFFSKYRKEINLQAQFPIGEYLKELDPDYSHPKFKTDFLMSVRKDQENYNIIIEYDGFDYHFKKSELINEFNFEYFNTEEHYERQKVLESYGYRFIRLNRFNCSDDPINFLNNFLFNIVDKGTTQNISDKIKKTAKLAQSKEAKHCKTCDKILPLENFKDNSLKTKYGNVCNKCRKPKNPYWGYRGYRRRY